MLFLISLFSNDEVTYLTCLMIIDVNPQNHELLTRITPYIRYTVYQISKLWEKSYKNGERGKFDRGIPYN